MAFLDLDRWRTHERVTGDRTEFIGRNGSLATAGGASAARPCRIASAPDSIRAARSSVTLDLEPSASSVFIGMLGDADDDVEARDR